MADFFQVEDLKVYRKLVDLHIEISDTSLKWPDFERYELGGQVRRSSNSAGANLAEKHSDRHVRNKIEGINRARTESLETVHHLYVAQRKNYLTYDAFRRLKNRYLECVRMLNGLERSLERQLPPKDRRWKDASEQSNQHDAKRPEP